MYDAHKVREQTRPGHVATEQSIVWVDATFHQKVKHVSGVTLNTFLPYIQASDHFMIIYKVVEKDLSIICYFVKNQLTLDFTIFFTITKIDFCLIPIPMAVQSSSQKTFCAAWPCEHSQRVKSCTKCL